MTTKDDLARLSDEMRAELLALIEDADGGRASGRETTRRRMRGDNGSRP